VKAIAVNTVQFAAWRLAADTPKFIGISYMQTQTPHGERLHFRRETKGVQPAWCRQSLPAGEKCFLSVVIFGRSVALPN
jgi:hypothetical protein